MVQFTSYTKKKIQIVWGSVQQIWLPADFYDRSFVVWYQPSTAQPPWTWLLVDRMVEVRSFNLTDDMDSWSLSTNPFVGHSSWLALILLFFWFSGVRGEKNMTHIFRTNFEFIFFSYMCICPLARGQLICFFSWCW